MRLIDADAFKRYIDCGHLRSPTETCFSELDVIRMIDKQPTVCSEPVRHGRWIQFDEDAWQCSACGVLWTFLDGGPEDNEAGYCPKCGAKMDGGADDD